MTCIDLTVSRLMSLKSCVESSHDVLLTSQLFVVFNLQLFKNSAVLKHGSHRLYCVSF